MKNVYENRLMAIEISDEPAGLAVDVRSKGEGNAALRVAYCNGVLTVYAIEEGVLAIPKEQNPSALHVEIRPKREIPEPPAEQKREILSPTAIAEHDQAGA